MFRPLYRDSSPRFDPARSHAGLWYDKFCNCWTGQSSAPEVQKLDWIRTVANGHPIGDEASLKDFVARQQNLIEAIKGKCVSLQTESRFVTGLGREHPIENGFAWHPTLGTPYLPGSSIKGMIRTWASQWEENDTPRALLDEILGCEARGDDRSAQAGTVIVFDAVPLRPVNLELDIMTPHYGEYYQEGKPSGDWISPTPIPFLVVAKGTRFQFAFAPRTSAGHAYLSTVEVWLKEALQWLGAGAKTAVGYGRFSELAEYAATEQDREQVETKGPRYGKGDIVTVTRIEDPKPKRGKSRVWVIADDGFGGVVPSGKQPEIALGESIQLQIAAVLQHGGYNFAVPK